MRLSLRLYLSQNFILDVLDILPFNDLLLSFDHI